MPMGGQAPPRPEWRPKSTIGLKFSPFVQVGRWRMSDAAPVLRMHNHEYGAALLVFRSLHLAVRGTTATLVSKYSEGCDGACRIWRLLNEYNVRSATQPPVRHGVPTRPGPPHLSGSDRPPQSRGNHHVGAVPLATPFRQSHQPVRGDHDRAGQLLPDQARVLHRRRVLRKAGQRTDLAGEHAR